MLFGVVIGVTVMVIGAYSEMANLLSIKLFDNDYKKARDSYRVGVRKNNERQ